MESPNPQLEVSENMEEAEGVPLNEYTTLKFNEENLRINLGLSRKGNSSHVWDYFGFLYNSHENAVLDSENVYCNLCFAAKELKRYGSKTSTGNLSGHLQKKHGVHPVSKNGETESTTKKQPQHSAANSGVKARRAAKTSTKKTEGVTRLSKELATWLARDLNPLSIVEGQGFKDFCRHFKIISGEGSIPGRHIISRVGLNDVYFSTVNIAKKLLQTAPKTIVVTFDSWTDRRKRQSHITYTIHWIDTQWKSQRVPLTTSCFPYPPLPSTIAENVNEVISEFGLADRKCIFVTGGGCNVKNACELHNVQQIDCVAYGVDLLLNKDFITDHLQLQGLTDTIEKLKTIYKQLIYRQSDLQRIFEEKHDTKLDEILDFLIDLDEIWESEERADRSGNTSNGISPQTDSRTPDLDGMLDFGSSTKWSTLLALMKNYLLNQNVFLSLAETSQGAIPFLQDDECEAVKSIDAILQVFSTTSEILCGEEYPPLNLSVLFRSAVIRRLQQETEKDDLSGTLSSALLTSVEKRLPLNGENICAALLDPSMRKLNAIEDYLRENGTNSTELLKAMAEAYAVVEENTDVFTENITKIVSSDGQQPMWKRLKTDFLKECTSVAQSNTLESEITKYFVITANDDDPLMWWKKNQHIFPHLSHLAKLFLGIPSTSAPSQRLFTVAGTLTTARRSDLHPLSAKQALFIHDNWHLTSEMDTRGKLQNVVVSS